MHTHSRCLAVRDSRDRAALAISPSQRAGSFLGAVGRKVDLWAHIIASRFVAHPNMKGAQKIKNIKSTRLVRRTPRSPVGGSEQSDVRAAMAKSAAEGEVDTVKAELAREMQSCESDELKEINDLIRQTGGGVDYALLRER